jgi:hypothetical protein
MEHTMAKTVRYPRKLRAKLEKIASGRDAREARAEPEIDPWHTFYRDFLPTGSVHLMHTVMTETLMRMETHMHMAAPYEPERIAVPPPWEGNPGASE